MNSDPMDDRHCTATSKQSGDRCKRIASPGCNVCSMHGAKAPQVRSRARLRLAEASARRLLADTTPEPVTDPLTALAVVAGEIVALKDILAEQVDELRGWTYTDRPGREEVRVVLAAYERSLDRCHRVLEGMSKLEIEDRLARLTERQAVLLTQVLVAALKRCDLPAEWRGSMQSALAYELRALSA